MKFLKFLTERRCVYCSSPYFKDEEKFHALCPNCAQKLKRMTRGYCKTCGTIQHNSLKNEVLNSCKICEEKPVQWKELYFFSAYEDILQDLIRQSKFHDNIIILPLLADILLPIIKEISYFDFLVPVPVHNKRLRKRGYNQCAEIAKHLHKKAKIPINMRALEKKIYTQSQASLSRKERLKNVKLSFIAHRKEVENKVILLFDDVSTTGSTFRECTNTLIKAGAKKVIVLYLAGVSLYRRC